MDILADIVLDIRHGGLKGGADLPRWNVRFDLDVAFGDAGLVRLISEATALSKVIYGVPLPPSIRREIDRLNIHRAVRGTTGIEGSDLTVEEVDRVLDADEGEHVLTDSRKREEQEVRNARDVHYYVADVLDANPDRPLTEETICEIHELTTSKIDYKDNVPGEYRNHPVHAGNYSAPATGEEVRQLMPQFIDWVNDAGTREWPPITRAIAAHFYLISIHPFGDGNGRTARAVESYLLYQAGINACGFYSLSNFYYNNRAEYESMLDYTRFSSGGSLTPLIKFSSAGLVGELETVHKEVLDQMTRISYRDYCYQCLMNTDKIGTKAGKRMFELIQALAVHGSVKLDDPHVQSSYARLSRKTLARDLAFLEAEDLVIREGNEVRANLAIMEHFKISRPGT